MSTRSTIGILNNDGKVECVYCHYDGYPQGVGETLKNFYTNEQIVRELLELGSLSVLGKRINPIGEHSFNKPEDDTTIAYHRDRGEQYQPPMVYDSIKEYISNVGRDCWADYVYLFTNGHWEYVDTYADELILQLF